jgi:hypothetical protein
MAEETNVTAVNDNTNAPQPSEAATQPEQQTMLGGNGTAAPTEEAAPVVPEAYDFKASIPEGVEMDEALTKDFSEVARSMNLTNEQANTMAQFGFKYGEQIANAVREQYSAEVTKWGEAAKAEMGANFDSIMSTAGAGIEAVEKVVPGIRQALNETGAGNRIEVIKAFEMLGQLVQADPGKMVNAGGTVDQPKGATTWYPNSKM